MCPQVLFVGTAAKPLPHWIASTYSAAASIAKRLASVDFPRRRSDTATLFIGHSVNSPATRPLRVKIDKSHREHKTSAFGGKRGRYSSHVRAVACRDSSLQRVSNHAYQLT